MISYASCPVCHSDQIHEQLWVKDHMVSQAFFPIMHCQRCTARFTNDIPDENEIGSYYRSTAYISHTGSRKGVLEGLYHAVRRRTLLGKASLLRDCLGMPTGRLLDYGCGTGAFVHTMLGLGWEVTGLEPDESAREHARQFYGLQVQPAADLHLLQEASFDAISLWHVLEHIHRLHETIGQFSRLLKPEGRLFVAVPNYLSLDARIYGADWAAWDVPRHLYHFTPRAIQYLCVGHGLELIRYEPMWWDSYYVSWLSERYRNNSLGPLTAFWNGFRSNLMARRNPETCSSLIYIIKKGKT